MIKLIELTLRNKKILGHALIGSEGKVSVHLKKEEMNGSGWKNIRIFRTIEQYKYFVELYCATEKIIFEE